MSQIHWGSETRRENAHQCLRTLHSHFSLRRTGRRDARVSMDYAGAIADNGGNSGKAAEVANSSSGKTLILAE